MEAVATDVNVHIFIRATETACGTGGAFRFGSSEMMDIFHSSSEEEMESLSLAGMFSDVSWEPQETVWQDVRTTLETI